MSLRFQKRDSGLWIFGLVANHISRALVSNNSPPFIQKLLQSTSTRMVGPVGVYSVRVLTRQHLAFQIVSNHAIFRVMCSHAHICGGLQKIILPTDISLLSGHVLLQFTLSRFIYKLRNDQPRLAILRNMNKCFLRLHIACSRTGLPFLTLRLDRFGVLYSFFFI